MCIGSEAVESVITTDWGYVMGNPLTDRWIDLKVVWDNVKIKTPREAATYAIKTFMPRYLPWTEKGKLRTACNILFTDVVQLLGLDGPYHWVDKKGNPMKFMPGVQLKGAELSANELVDWFHAYGNAYGYVQLSRGEAETLAATGALVAVMYKNPNPADSGHIGIMLENGTLAQAGRGIPFVGHPIEVGFGSLPTEFWGYVERGLEYA